MNPVRNSPPQPVGRARAGAISNGVKVLMIGGDKRSLEKGSAAWQRLELQRSAVEQLDIYVWPHVHSVWNILGAARHTRYDVVTSQDPFWRGLIAWLAARLSGARLNVQVHTDLSAYSGIKHVLAQIVLRHADSIRVVSERIKMQVEKMGVRGKISVLPVFVDTQKFSSSAKRPHIGKNILWIGRFEREKDPLAAVEVFRAFRASVPDAKLVMLGDGTLLGSVRRKASGLPVELVGWQDSSRFLETADVVLSTSCHESWGQSIVEALAAGVPVVAPDVGIAREAGAIVVPREKLADKVIEVLKSGASGQLRLHLLNASDWATVWKESL